MKQKLLNSIRLRALMLVAVLCAAFAGQAWGQAVTLYSESFGDNGSSNTAFSSYSGYSAVTSMFTGSGTVASHYTGSGKVGKNSVSPSDTYSGASGKSAAWYQASAGSSTTDVLIISGIKISGYESLNLSFGMNMTTGKSNTNTTTVSYKIDDGEFQSLSFTHPTSSGWGLKSGSISGTGSSLTIKFTMTTTGGFTTRYDDIKVTGVAAAPSYSITAVSNNESYGTVSLSSPTITGSPKSGYRYASPAYTVTSGTATVAQDGNYFTVTPSEDCTVQINFEPIPTHTATFSVNGNTSRTATVAEGAAITFPEAVADPSASQIPETYNGKTFLGWYTEEYTNASVAPDYVNTATATMGVANVTYYAVYADVAEEESEDVKDAVKSQTLQYDGWTYSGTTTDKSSYRLFGNGSYIESEAFDLSKLIKVVVYGGTFGGGTYNSISIGDGTSTWKDVTVSGSSQTGENIYTGGTALSGTKALRVTSKSGDGSSSGVRISKVEIYVKGTTRTESNYTTDIRSEAGISFAEAEVSVQRTSGYAGQALTNPNSLTVAYSSSDETVATVNSLTGAIMELKKAGITNITATFAGDATYKPAEVSYELTVTEKLPNGLVYAVAEVEKLTTDAAFTNELTNGYSLTVAYSSNNTEVATVNAFTGEVTIKGAGSTTITATFAGDATYEEGEASYTLTVSKATPTLSFAKSSVNVELDEGTYKQVVTTEPADLPVTYSSSKGSVATVASDGTVTLLTTGSTTITANFAGNDLYNSANVSYTLKVDVSATLPFSFNNGKGSLPTGMTQSGLGTDYDSENAKLRFDNTGDNLILKMNAAPAYLSFALKGNGFSGGTFKVQISADGVDYSDLASVTSISNVAQYETFYEFPSTTRYIKWIYTTKSTGNIGLGSIQVKAGEPITIGSAGYTTYVPKHKVSFPDGVTGYIATATGASTVTLNSVDVVPVGTPLVLKATAGSYELPVTEESADDVSGNLLQASDGSVTSDGSTIFALGVGKTGENEGKIGFYLVKKDETIPAGKAYLTVPASVKEFLTFVFDDLPTTVSEVKNDGVNTEKSIFNLAGQKMSKLQKGVNIVNGKKVLVK